MNINSITNSIASNFKFKTRKKSTTNSVDANIKENLEANKQGSKSIAEQSEEFRTKDFDYLPAGSENNNWDENSDLNAYFSASRHPRNKGMYIDTYA